MDSVHGFATDQGQLAGVVRGVRNRWRLKRALHGATLTVAAGFVVLARVGVRDPRAALRRRVALGVQDALARGDRGGACPLHRAPRARRRRATPRSRSTSRSTKRRSTAR